MNLCGVVFRSCYDYCLRFEFDEMEAMRMIQWFHHVLLKWECFDGFIMYCNGPRFIKR